MAEDKNDITEEVIEEAVIITAEQELIEKENAIIVQAQAIQEKRDKVYKEEEAIILVELEKEFSLGKKELDQCKEVELALGKPENKVKTIIDAMSFYQDKTLKKEQLAFMAINANSRANMYRNQLESMGKEVEGAQKQVEALMRLSAMQNGAKMEIVPSEPKDTEDIKDIKGLKK